MDSELKSFLLTHNGFFDSKDLKLYILKEGGIPRSRTAAFAYAKELRCNFSFTFARVLKVGDSYFIIVDEDAYKFLWEARKIALRNERRIKNEIV